MSSEEFTPEQLAEIEAYKEGKIDKLSVETKYTMGLINESEYKLLRCVKDWADSSEVIQCQYHGIVKDS